MLTSSSVDNWKEIATIKQTGNAAHAMPVSPLLLQKPQLNKTSELPARKPRHLVRSTQQRKSSRHRSVPREQELFGQLQCCQYPDQFLHSSDHSFHSLTADQCCSKCPIQCSSNGGEAGDSTQTRRRVHFDFNGNGVGMRTRIELRNLMGQLLQHRKNCCLLRFSNQRRCSMLFLHQLLVRQLDNCLHTMKGKLMAVHLTYYDLRRHDTCNAFRKVQRYKQSFKTSMQLYKWLEREYKNLFGTGLRHEWFDIELDYITVSTNTPTITRAKLILIQMYLHNMFAETRHSLCNLLRIPVMLTDQKYRTKDPSDYCFLQECLSQFLCGGGKWATLVVFDVSRQCGDVTNDMLKLARAAYDGIKVEKKLLLDKQKPDTKRDTRLSAGATEVESVATKPLPKDPKAKDCVRDWMAIADSKIDAVMKALQEYYDFKYNQKVIKISDCMRQLSTPKDTTEKTTLGSNVTPAADLQWYQNRYKLAEIDLDHFLDDIKFSNLKADLMPIMVTKLKKLNKATMEYKVQKLRECKEQLDEIINSEIQMLQNFPRKASITNLNATWYFPGDTTAANIL